MDYTAELFELERQITDITDEINEMDENFSPKHLKDLVNKRERLRIDKQLLQSKHKK
jgi:hypothetical protein